MYNNCHLHICCQFILLIFTISKTLFRYYGKRKKSMSSWQEDQESKKHQVIIVNFFLSFFLSVFSLKYMYLYSLLCLFLYFSLCVIQEDDDLTVELEEEGKLTYLINKLINPFSPIFVFFLVGGCLTSSNIQKRHGSQTWTSNGYN